MTYSIARSIDLLKTTSRSISDIALDCGFNNLANFNRIFKRTTGQTPSALRAQLG